MRLWWLPLMLACNGRCRRDSGECESADRLTWYADEDGDGHGDPMGAVTSCEQPSESVSAADDCDDLDEDHWRSASLWVDGDGDGYGDGQASEVCEGASGYAAQDGDCDDHDAGRFPGADPVCQDDLDQDCDGQSDCPAPAGADEVTDVAFTRFYGENAGALGSAVAGLGDLDGDGTPDLGLGAPDADPWGGGLIWFGPTDSIEDAASADIVLSSVATDADEDSIEVGAALAAADITGDGVRDLLVGAGGSWFAYSGDSTFIFAGPVSPGEIVVNDDSSAILLLNAGGETLLTDVNYLGTDEVDLLIGSGKIDLYRGPIEAGGDSDEIRDGVLQNNSYDNGTLGTSMAVGDMNADGTLDLLVGTPEMEGDLPATETRGDLGAAFVFADPSDLTSEGSAFSCCEDLSIFGNTDGAQLGAAVAYTNDPDGDGYDDLYIGAPGAENERGEATGAVYYFDGATLAALDRESEVYADSATFAVYGGEAGDEFGASLLTGLLIDDQATLVIGAPGHDDDSGAVALWYEQPTAGDTLYEADYRLAGTAAGDRFGAALANAGDTNGLGWDDLLIGAPGTSGGDGAGWLLVFDQL